ncbi:hypothetical protein EKN56_19205 [Limnobaculum zhutongyuii]|uniref:Uncharacterized protein n=1 Tax=Limnobaculum zhutongyuii TaxID=2498113 RepID=A0A411WQC1_9GAMM|nr:hypothetical protein [Limnobaculum zhutongyuii]QBH98330.1 hypothetical protein EKN56_19205 [Limnobaculum zhutongyuii]TQS89773.1 hypothetical protein ELQ32_05035 [Limnobaculum zhutongyuii]
MTKARRNHLRLVVDNTRNNPPSAQREPIQTRHFTAEQLVAQTTDTPADHFSLLKAAAAREKTLTQMKVQEELQSRLKKLKTDHPDIDITLPFEQQSEEHRKLMIESFPHYFNGGAFVYWEDMEELIFLEPDED